MFPIVKAVTLLTAAIAAWIATAVLGVMCLFSVVLGPLAVGIFVATAAVANLAFWLSAAAVDAALDLFPSKSTEKFCHERH